MTGERMTVLLGKMEEATTDGDLSDFTQEDIGEMYLWMLQQTDQRTAGYEAFREALTSKLQETRRMGEQKDDPEMANRAQLILTWIESALTAVPRQ
jgi:hypothetical protein